jgi:fatty acid desaturase
VEEKLAEKLSRPKLVNADGLSYSEFRKALTPRWNIVWRHIGLGWVALVLINLVVVVLSGHSLALDFLLVAIGSILIGFTIAYLQLFLHEASHYNLHRDRAINDLLCNVFVSGIVGLEVKNYRPIHWDHHRYLGTSKDTENTYFNDLNIKFFVETLLNIRTLKVIRNRKQKLRDREDLDKLGVQKPKPYTLIGGLVFNLALVLFLAWFHQWPALLAWLGGIVVFFPFFGALRQLLEHRDENADPAADYSTVAHGEVHRIFGDGLFASVFGGAGFNRHLLHHWEPQVSYTRLKELEAYLMGTEGADYLRKRQATYAGTFRRLFHPIWK